MVQGAAVPSGEMALAEFAADGNQWEQVTRAYRMPLRRFFSGRVRSPVDVDDLVQQVFVRLLQRAQGEPILNIPGYVFQVAASVLNDERRRAKARYADAHESFDEADHAGANEITPERIVLGEEAIERVAAAVRKLPEVMRDVYVLRVMRECEYADIARQLGISERGAQRHMARTLRYLEDELNGNGPAASASKGVIKFPWNRKRF